MNANDSKTPLLMVDRKELYESLNLMSKFMKRKKLKTEAVVLSFDGQFLIIDSSVMAEKVKAEGYWPGQAHVAFNLLMILPQSEFETDTLEFRISGDKIQIQTFSLLCTWHPGNVT